MNVNSGLIHNHLLNHKRFTYSNNRHFRIKLRDRYYQIQENTIFKLST